MVIHLRSEPAARRAHVRAAVQDRVRRAADRPVPARHGVDERRVLGPGYMNWDISFFKHVPMGGNAAAAVPRRALQRVQHRSSGRGVDTARDLRLRHRRADRRELRQADRRHHQRAPHPARRAVHVRGEGSWWCGCLRTGRGGICRRDLADRGAAMGGGVPPRRLGGVRAERRELVGRGRPRTAGAGGQARSADPANRSSPSTSSSLTRPG